MSEHKQNTEIKLGSDRSFGIVFAVVFALIASYPFYWGKTPHWWALAIAVGFLAVAVLRPSALRPLNLLWFRFGLLLNKIVSPVVMGLLFLFVFLDLWFPGGRSTEA